ncbi:MAG: insulinase family protein [Defluviitaleaceae bacterium]|nr:insulinase family protein [Defluviitaleaceae bacterium]
MENYRLIEQVDLAHIGCVGWLYEHLSGAQVLHLASDDDNKVFSVAFKTPPVDDTGIAHIMEHCVLAGSRKYPLKDPFMQLANSSLYTFLNALTYPDKTVYPIASANDADFMNLMDVYLDAVFFPMVYEREFSLWQEGWHYRLEDDELKYNGVVYNEMKGAFSDPYRVLFSALDKELFADSIYCFESGGDPKAIPQIDYKYFIDFHKEHYRPENAFIYFYGDMDIEDCFRKLDEGYLSKFDKIGITIDIKPQPVLDTPIFVECEYSVADEDALEDNYMAVSFVFSPDMPALDVSAFKVLNYILMNTAASPLYKAMVEAEIGEDIAGQFSQDTMHASWGISMCNATITTAEFKEFLENALAKIAADGLSSDFVGACLNFLEFQAKEEDYGASNPKGLVYNMRSLGSWLYKKTPWERLNGILHLEQIRENAKTSGYFERLIQKYLLDNTHCGYGIIKPVLHLDDKKEEIIAEKLSQIKAQMTDNDLSQIERNMAELKAFQETPDTPEVLAMMPSLCVSDIKPQIEVVSLEAKEVGGTKLLYSPLETNDIIYTTMLFDMSALPQNLLPVANILQYMLANVATKNYDTVGITQEIKSNLGGLGFSTDVSNKSANDFSPQAIVSAKFLSQNTNKMFYIIDEILHNSLFNDKSQVRNYLLEMKAAMDDNILTSGTTVAIMRAGTYFSAAAAYQDAVSGLGSYDYLKELLDNFDTRFEGLQTDLQQTAKYIYNKNNAQYSIVANEKLYEKFAKGLCDFNNGLLGDTVAKSEFPLIVTPKNEGFITASKVQYVALAADYFADGFAYEGGLRVLGKILDNYLYEEIRAKGGAYGCGCAFGVRGGMFMYSYRDPQMEGTLDVFRATANYIRNLELADNEIENYIIGTIRGFDRPATNAQKGFMAASNYILGWTDEMRQKERDEILGTNLAKIRSFADLLDKAVAQNNICAVGSAAAIDGKSIFGNIRRI